MTPPVITDSMGSDLLAILFAPAEQPKPVPVAAPNKFVKRYFYRCADCLTVAATETKIPDGKDEYGYSNRQPGAVCDACGGKIEFMGETYRQSLQTITGYRAVCDGKCIGARGPSCDCKCGGEHHGSGMVVPIIETGSIPRLGIAGPKAKLAGETWRALVSRYKAAWTARYGRVVAEKHAGAYLCGDEFARYCESGRTTARFHAIKAGRTTARNKKLEALAIEIGGVR